MAVATKADYTENTVMAQLRKTYDIDKLRFLRNRLDEQVKFMYRRINNNDKVQFSDVNRRKLFSDILKDIPKLADIVNELPGLHERVHLVKKAIELAIEGK